MKKTLVYITLFAISTSVFSQSAAFEHIEIEDKGRLVQKADAYFDKLWYVKAAEYYEKALHKNEQSRTYVSMEKAADAYYLNNDMKKANYWYTQIYQKYGKKMTPQTLFKYSHTLKGVNLYRKSKKMLRLYQKRSATAAPVETDSLDRLLTHEAPVVIKNVALNSQYSEFSPTFYKGQQLVYATSNHQDGKKYKWNEKPFLDLYIAEQDSTTQELTNPIQLSEPINSKYHEASAAFSPDRKTVYFTRNNYDKRLKHDANGINHLKLYSSQQANGKWSAPIELPFNNDTYSTGHPALSTNGKKLYFISDMPGSLGMTDIFVVDILENGAYSSPINLGPKVNTPHREMFPFIGNNQLYFSSDGRLGLGGLDIFKSEFTDDNEGFKKPKNMGKPFNSNKDDFSFITKDDSLTGYFASNREGGKGDDDIYSFKPEIIEAVKTSITGSVTDLDSSLPISGAKVRLFDENAILVKEAQTSSEGSFLFERLKANTNYTLKASVTNYADNELTINTKENTNVQADIALQPYHELIVQEGNQKKIQLDNILFDFNKYAILENASLELDKLVAVMSEYTTMVIKIESHTDSRGSRKYNQTLSDNRAKATRDYLISKGINGTRIQSALGYGEDRLRNDCDNSKWCAPVRHEQNRRSDFIIVKM